MSVNRAMDPDIEDNTICNDVLILYKPKSDFFNLSKLKYVKLARKLEAMKRKESQSTERTPTLKRWIWESMVGVMDTVVSSVRMNMKVKQKPNGDVRLKIRREKYIMGILSERESITCSLFKTLRSLSEEEWGFVNVAPEEAQETELLVWSPDRNPRPKWLVQREKMLREKREKMLIFSILPFSILPTTELSQGEISEEGVLEDTVTSEESIIELHKKDAIHAKVSSGHEIRVSNVATSRLDRTKPGHAYNTSK